jgi:hypothetical protein
VALNSGSTGTLTGKLYRALQDIQYGTAPRPDWTLEVQVQ